AIKLEPWVNFSHRGYTAIRLNLSSNSKVRFSVTEQFYPEEVLITLNKFTSLISLKNLRGDISILSTRVQGCTVQISYIVTKPINSSPGYLSSLQNLELDSTTINKHRVFSPPQSASQIAS